MSDTLESVLENDNMWGKVVFLILVVISFIIILRGSISALTYIFAPKSSPYLVKGMKNARKMSVISQDPNDKKTIPIMRSTNQRYGLEYTWTVWLYINDIDNTTPSQLRRHIFHKGSEGKDTRTVPPPGGKNLDMNVGFPHNGPGMYLEGGTNEIVVIVSTPSEIAEEVKIQNIPLNKWFNITIRQRSKIMDIYINGTIRKRHEFDRIPIQNYGDVYVNKNNGYEGELSALQYHDRALTGVEIMEIVDKGPDLSTDEESVVAPPYLSLRWFLDPTQ